MARSFFSRVIADAQRPLPACSKMKWNPGQRPVAAMTSSHEPLKADAGVKSETTTPTSKSQAASFPLLSASESDVSATQMSSAIALATDQSVAAGGDRMNNRKGLFAYSRDEKRTDEQTQAAQLKQSTSSLEISHDPGVNLSKASVVHQEDAEVDSFAKQPMGAEPFKLKTINPRKGIQEPSVSVSSELENRHAGNIAEVFPTPEGHAERESFSVSQDDEDGQEAVLNQAPTIAMKNINPPARVSSPAESNHAPQVHIGRVDVVIIADHKEATKQQASSADNSFSSRNYLRRL